MTFQADQKCLGLPKLKQGVGRGFASQKEGFKVFELKETMGLRCRGSALETLGCKEVTTSKFKTPLVQGAGSSPGARLFGVLVAAGVY